MYSGNCSVHKTKLTGYCYTILMSQKMMNYMGLSIFRCELYCYQMISADKLDDHAIQVFGSVY